MASSSQSYHNDSGDTCPLPAIACIGKGYSWRAFSQLLGSALGLGCPDSCDWAFLFPEDEHPELAANVIRVLVFPADRQPPDLSGYDWGMTWHGGKPQQAPLLEWFPWSERAEPRAAVALTHKLLKRSQVSSFERPLLTQIRQLACQADFGSESLPKEWMTRLKAALSLPAQFPKARADCQEEQQPPIQFSSWCSHLLESRSELGWCEITRRDGAWRILDKDGRLALVLLHPWLDPITLDGLCEALERLDSADSKSLEIVAGNVNFCQGANLELAKSDLQQGQIGRIQSRLERLHRFLDDLEEATKPVGAAVRGSALGGGCELALVVPHARFGRDLRMGFVESRMGLIPAGGGLAQILHRSRSADDLQRYFRQIVGAQVSSDVWQAASLGYVGPAQYSAAASWQELLDDLAREMEAQSYQPKDRYLYGWCRPDQLLDALPLELRQTSVARVLSQVLGLPPGTRATHRQIRSLEREGYLELLRQPGALGA